MFRLYGAAPDCCYGSLCGARGQLFQPARGFWVVSKPSRKTGNNGGIHYARSYRSIAAVFDVFASGVIPGRPVRFASAAISAAAVDFFQAKEHFFHKISGSTRRTQENAPFPPYRQCLPYMNRVENPQFRICSLESSHVDFSNKVAGICPPMNSTQSNADRLRFRN